MRKKGCEEKSDVGMTCKEKSDAGMMPKENAA